MRRKKTSVLRHRTMNETPLPERREFERVGLPATAFAVDAEGNDMGRVVEIGGGGLQSESGFAMGAGFFGSRDSASSLPSLNPPRATKPICQWKSATSVRTPSDLRFL